MRVYPIAIVVPTIGLAAALLAARGGERNLTGACGTVFDAQVCTWGVVRDGKVAEFGATVPLAAIQNAPMEGEMVFPPRPAAVIPLPAEVVAATGFNHLGINWEMHGHPPALFLTPHFDFHFYTIDPTSVEAIDCTDSEKPTHIPASYSLPDLDIPGLGTLVGLCVPHMGMHGMPTDEVSETDPFGASMLIGYYGKDLVFLEPMISQAKLAEEHTFTMDVPALPSANAAVRWPAAFRAEYDTEKQTYRLVFSGLSSN